MLSTSLDRRALAIQHSGQLAGPLDRAVPRSDADRFEALARSCGLRRINYVSTWGARGGGGFLDNRARHDIPVPGGGPSLRIASMLGGFED